MDDGQDTNGIVRHAEIDRERKLIHDRFTGVAQNNGIQFVVSYGTLQFLLDASLTPDAHVRVRCSVRTHRIRNTPEVPADERRPFSSTLSANRPLNVFPGNR